MPASTASSSTKEVCTMIRTATRMTSTMQYWLWVMESQAKARNTGSSRTAGVRIGETKATYRWHVTATTSAALPTSPVFPSCNCPSWPGEQSGGAFAQSYFETITHNLN
uniref:Uncharacterized protein n=1 Tax=Anguilla anguilla TaxID=7936 RepID=A0A0E9WSA1_ANGAN